MDGALSLTATGATAVSSEAGIAVNVSGSGQYLTNTSNTLATSVPLTFIARVFVRSGAGTIRRIFDVSTGTTADDVIGIYHDANFFAAQHYDGGSNDVVQGGVITGAWVTVCARFASLSSRQLFINGVLAGSSSSSLSAPSGVNRITLGYAPWSGGEYFDGQYAWAILATSVLTDAEILSIHQDQYWALIEPVQRDIFVPVSSGPGPIGLASETDTAFAVTAAKGLAVGLNAETDTALALTAQKTAAAGLAISSESAQPITVIKTAAIGIVTETDSAFGLGSGLSVAVGQAQETEAALTLSAGKTVTVGINADTDTAQTITAEKIYPLSLVVEVDTAASLGTGQFGAIGLLDESEGVFSLSSLKVKTVGLASEASTAFNISIPSSRTLTQADIDAIADAVWAHPKALTVGKFLALK